MKKSEFLQKLYDAVDVEIHYRRYMPENLVDLILKKCLEYGMRPPSLDEDKCQALMHVYYAGYTFNQWDEDFEKDTKAMAAYQQRIERKKNREET